MAFEYSKRDEFKRIFLWGKSQFSFRQFAEYPTIIVMKSVSPLSVIWKRIVDFRLAAFRQSISLERTSDKGFNIEISRRDFIIVVTSTIELCSSDDIFIVYYKCLASRLYVRTQCGDLWPECDWSSDIVRRCGNTPTASALLYRLRSTKISKKFFCISVCLLVGSRFLSSSFSFFASTTNDDVIYKMNYIAERLLKIAKFAADRTGLAQI